MKPKTFLIGLIGFFIVISCTKEPFPELPDETQEGLGKFGCFVNGQLVVPQYRSSIFIRHSGFLVFGHHHPSTNQF